MYTINDLYDLTHTLAGDYLARFTYPWEALSDLADCIRALGAQLDSEYLPFGPEVWVHRTAHIAPTASMTVHPVRMSGTVIAAPETYRYFERLQERIIQFVAANSRVTAERFRELMLSSGDMANDVGTVLYGEQAVAEGIIDRIGTLGDALEALYGQIERRHG